MCCLLSGSYHDFLQDFHSSATLGGKSSWLYLATSSVFPNPSLETVLKSLPARDEVRFVTLLFLWDLALETVH